MTPTTPGVVKMGQAAVGACLRQLWFNFRPGLFDVSHHHEVGLGRVYIDATSTRIRVPVGSTRPNAMTGSAAARTKK
jgi:hypothetical protein